MKKKLTLVFMSIVMVMTFTTAAFAMSYSNSGTWVGTFSGNDDIAAVEAALGGVDLIWESEATPVAGTLGSTWDGDFALYITTEDGWLSGEWATFTPVVSSPIPAGSVEVAYYTVKAGNQYALYFVNPASAYGTWSTMDLFVGSGQQPTISHFTGFTLTSVPEPTTLLLLGLGLVGIAGIRRKLTK